MDQCAHNRPVRDATRPRPYKHRLQCCQSKEIYSKVSPACSLTPLPGK